MHQTSKDRPTFSAVERESIKRVSSLLRAESESDVSSTVVELWRVVEVEIGRYERGEPSAAAEPIAIDDLSDADRASIARTVAALESEAAAMLAADRDSLVWGFWTGLARALRALFDPIEPEWPEGHEPARAAIVVPGVYVDLFRREVDDERDLHLEVSLTPGQDEDGESARIVWSFDEILSQLPAQVGGEDVEVLVPVHPDGSEALARWLRNDDCSPFPPDRATAGLRATTVEGRRSGIAIARAWLDVLDQLDGLNTRVAA